MSLRVAIVGTMAGVVVAGGNCARCDQTRQPMHVESATIDKDGRVSLRWTGQPEKMIARDRDGYCESEHCEDAGSDQLKISANRLSVGWVAQYNGCCQSYPLPMVLIIARNGRVLKRIQPIRPVFDWRFEQGDRLVALYTDTSHFTPMPECELYDMQTGKRIATWKPGDTPKPPAWAAPFAKDLRE